MIKAVAYARYSSDNQRDESIDAQLRAIEEYAKREGYIIVGKYIDQALSATTDQRPEFQRMISDAENKSFSAVIVHKLDRFSRNRYDSAIYKRKLREMNVQLVSVLENIDGSPESIILESVLQGMAEYYSENLSREVKKGMNENALKAKFNGGIVPLGYYIDDHQNYQINEAEAAVIRLIFDLYLSDIGYNEIIKDLNGRGYKTRLGKPFGKNSLYSILANEKYAGIYRFNVLQTKKFGKRVQIKRDESEVVTIVGGVPAIISMDDWESVVRKKKMNQKNAGYKTEEPGTYLLTSKIKCDLCGGAMNGRVIKKETKSYYYYECATRRRNGECSMKMIDRDFIESLVLERITKELISDKVMESTVDFIYQETRRRMDKLPSELETLDLQIDEINKGLDGYMKAIEAGLFTMDMKDKVLELEDRKSYLLKLKQEHSAKISKLNYTKEQIREFLEHNSKLLSQDRIAQKKALSILLHKVVIGEETIQIQVLTKKEGDNHVSPELVPAVGLEPTRA